MPPPVEPGRRHGGGPLRVRWLGRVGYLDAHAVQRALFARSAEDYLLLLEHPHVYTLGVRADRGHLLAEPRSVGAELVRVDRGGDVTYHGPGQLVGYPIVSVPTEPGATAGYVARVEEAIIAALADLGLPGAGRLPGYPGVWLDPEGPGARKICAVGVRLSRGRSMHGFALNLDPDLAYFSRIVPCGIPDKAVTSLRAEGRTPSMAEVVEAVATRLAEQLAPGRGVERQGLPFGAPAREAARVTLGAPRSAARLAAAGTDPAASLALGERKPAWLRARARMGPEYLGLKRTLRQLSLVTVCEEAGCPNIFECWGDGTATFMINGARCTRSCGFCLVDTRRPLPVDPDEPERVAEAVARMGLAHAVVTAVARDDLEDGGAEGFALTIAAIRRRCPTTSVEVLIPDCRGSDAHLSTIFQARPEVLNHNLETVVRLQRAVRPQASYARSLSVLARAKEAGLQTKSGLILGLGEREDEVRGALVDLRSVGVDIVTLGQYLRPSAEHLPVARWWRPEEFDALAETARGLGFSYVQASPLTRSSYHARAAAAGCSE
ncbi:MAG: lipoyl synthase [Acidimicrobiales bacterium]|nr:lipoyl synthase [Acidimicrobiales bacterium]